MPEFIDVRTEPGWDDAIGGTDAELFIGSRWAEVLADSFNVQVQASVERSADGRVAAAVPFACIDDVRGARLAMLPFSDFVSPVGISDAATWDRLVRPLLDLGRPMTFNTVAGTPAADDERFVADGGSVRHRIPLDGPADQLFARFSSHHRRLIRKADRVGLRFGLAETRADLRAFYELHLGVRRHRYGMLAQPYTLFESLWDRFLEPGLGDLVLGFDGDTVVGGCLLLEAGDTFYYKYAASHPDYRSAGASHGAVMHAVGRGIERGLVALDLGRSDTDQPGLVDFKRRFGAEVSELCRYRSKDQLFREASEMDRLLTELTGLLTRPSVPDPITEQAGALLYRLFA
ncbi:MAG: GNAT family N-acetyltransferase [Actinomycetota bacterium]